MTLSRETELGTISVSNILFAQIIADSFQQASCRNKVWPSTKKGRQIGNMGNSGNSYGNHLHFEVWQNGERTDALGFFKAKE